MPKPNKKQMMVYKNYAKINKENYIWATTKGEELSTLCVARESATTLVDLDT